MDLGEYDTRELLAEVAGDPDSLALLETWLDKNRAGWREYFAEQDGAAAGASSSGSSSTRSDPEAEAYSVLGLEPGATAEDIREAHHKLMKKVHPDQGGSTYLASKINEAKDRLLKKVGS
jgi:DnaJ-domain-containing protein 1